VKKPASAVESNEVEGNDYKTRKKKKKRRRATKFVVSHLVEREKLGRVGKRQKKRSKQRTMAGG